ncbi:MAG TPA: hypothetical protein VFF76_09100 [Holophagaceae bacterium]|jgi:hypothetical protein|nr:hypothetical protein [Holophagaceae bacterium]
MRPYTRSCPGSAVVLMSAAFLGLAVLTACGRKDAGEEGPKFIQPGIAATQAPAPEPTGDQPGLPVVRIQADALVAAGTGGHQATVSGDAGLQYEWFIQGGAFEGDIHSQSVNWSAGVPGEVRLFCQGTNTAGKKSVTLARVQSEAPPSIEGFRATPLVVSVGHATKLSWTAKEIKTLILDPGGLDVTKASGPGFEVKPSGNLRYTLTATNNAGATVSKTVDVRVVPLPAISSLGAQGAINIGQPFTLVGVFKGGKAELRQGGTVLASGDTSPLQAQIPALKAGDSFQLTVTNEAGDSLTRTLVLNPNTGPGYQK